MGNGAMPTFTTEKARNMGRSTYEYDTKLREEVSE